MTLNKVFTKDDYDLKIIVANTRSISTYLSHYIIRLYNIISGAMVKSVKGLTLKKKFANKRDYSALVNTRF